MQQEIIREELAFSGYDRQAETLLVSELQAFLWEPSKAALNDVRLRDQGTGIDAVRERFLAGIDNARPTLTTFFDAPAMRTVAQWVPERRLEKTVARHGGDVSPRWPMRTRPGEHQ